MKKFILIFFTSILFAQTDTTVDLLNQAITSHNQQILALQTKAAFYDNLNSKCPSCIDAINNVINNSPITLGGVQICCGMNTVPQVPQGSSIIYIFPLTQVANLGVH